MNTLPQINEEVNPLGITQEMTPDEAAASLALATRLSEEQLIAQNPMVEAPQETPVAPEMDVKTEMADMQEEIQSIKDELEELLKEDDKEEKQDGEEGQD